MLGGINMSNSVVLIAYLRYVFRDKPQKIGRKLSARQKLSDAAVDVVQVLRGQLDKSVEQSNLAVKFDLVPKPLFLKKGALIQIGGKINPMTKKLSLLTATELNVLSSKAAEVVRKKLNVDPQQLRNEAVQAGGFNLTDAPQVPEELESPEVQGIQSFLHKLGFSFDREMAFKILVFYTHRAASAKMTVQNMLEKNPLILADLNEQQFTVAKLLQAARNVGIDILPEVELFAKVSAVLHREARKGNACYPILALCWETTLRDSLLKLQIPEKEWFYHLASRLNVITGMSNIVVSIKELKDQKAALQKYYETAYRKAGIEKSEIKARIINSVLYLKNSYFAERHAAERLAERCAQEPLPDYYADIANLQLNGQQKLAVRMAFTNKVSVIVGSGGTGKTFTVREIVLLLKRHGEKAIILAPSAMAAVTAAKKSDFESPYSTIHRFAKILPEDEDLGASKATTILNQANDTLLSNVRFIIVDEMSMCTLPVFSKLLTTIKNYPELRLLLVGDPAQLPAIGPQFFHQIADGLFTDLPVTTLTQNQRSKQTGITAFGEAIRAGQVVFSQNDSTVVLYEDSFEEFSAMHPDILTDKSVLFLSNSRSRVHELNVLLRQKQNQGAAAIEGTAFYQFDPVVATQNDYARSGCRTFTIARHPDRAIDVYNGTQGRIEVVMVNDVYVRLFTPENPEKGELVPYKKRELSIYFDVAYALTVHKAQGCERDTVVLTFNPKKTGYITRNMLYTATTRAKKKLYLIGAKDVFIQAAKKPAKPALTKLAFRFLDKKAALVEPILSAVHEVMI
jgi:hypothetical protein